MTKLQVALDATGRIGTIRIAEPSGPTPEHHLLDLAAQEAAAHCKGSPSPDGAAQSTALRYAWLEGAQTTTRAATPAPNGGSSPAILDTSTACPRPEFPLTALRAGAFGVTRLRLEVDGEGRVGAITVLSSAGPTPEHRLLDAAIAKAMRQCRFPIAKDERYPRIDYVWRLADDDAAQTSADALPPALRPILEKATRGDVGAQRTLADHYARGSGDDQRQASSWYRRAALQGDADAQTFLGQRTLAGRGVPADDALAASWLRKASDQGNAVAAFTLGLMAQMKRGPDATPAAAIRWLELAADRGLGDAFDELGAAHEQGAGVAKDAGLAAVYYCIAQRKGVAEAAGHLAAAGAKTGDARGDRACERATRWLAEAAAGHAPPLPGVER